jgi:hypothetical protein
MSARDVEDTRRRLLEAADFMAQERAVYVPDLLLTAARQLGELSRAATELATLRAENARLREALDATAALTPAGYVILPAEMTVEQAARSLDGHALADRVRDVNPEMFARLVEMRRATWRQMVAVMQEPPADG